MNKLRSNSNSIHDFGSFQNKLLFQLYISLLIVFGKRTASHAQLIYKSISSRRKFFFSLLFLLYLLVNSFQHFLIAIEFFAVSCIFALSNYHATIHNIVFRWLTSKLFQKFIKTEQRQRPQLNIFPQFLILKRYFISKRMQAGEHASHTHSVSKDGHSIVLKSGDHMPLVGFGTWKLPKDISEEMIYQAIKSGYRLIDCAALYGNQVEIGRGIKRAIEDNIITRKQLFVTSKLWSTFKRPEHVKEGFNRTLSDLGLEYLDLYLIHNPTALKYVDPKVAYPTGFEYVPTPKEGPKIILDNVPIIDTWRAMEELVSSGKCKNIGVSNFSISLLRDLIASAKVHPAVNQVEIHPYLTQKRLINFCQKHAVEITSYSTMGGTSYVELSIAKNEELIVDTEVVKKIAQKHGKTGPQILFRWAIQQNLAVIPKTSKAERLKENLDVFGWTLSAEEMKEIDGLNKNKRYCEPANFLGEDRAIDIAWD